MKGLRMMTCLAAAGLLVGCASEDAGDTARTGETGKLVAAFGFDGPTHDVAFMGYSLYAGEVDCAVADDADALYNIVVGLEEEFLPPWLEQDGSGGDMHPFADALFVLQPGAYTVCATPMTLPGVPSEHCAPTSGTATVMAEMTTEIVLYSQCLGDPTGALDVVVALNDPPHIDNLVIDPSKFPTVCEETSITVFASDPNGDALTFSWSAVSPGGDLVAFPETGPTLTLVPPAPGPWSFTVVVTDGHGGAATLTFPLHPSAADCGPVEPPPVGLCPADVFDPGVQCADGDQCVFPDICCPAPDEDVCASGGGCFCDAGVWQCAIPIIVCPEPAP